MTAAITLWLAIVLGIGVIAWFGTRKQAIAFLVVATMTAPAVIIPLGHATPLAPPAGQYSVLGAKIEIDTAIYVLLDNGQGEPRLYRLPYTSAAANQLQQTMDLVQFGQNGGGSVGMSMGEDGSPGFAEEGVTGAEQQKTADQPLLVTP